jgi:hypothetical protein
MITIKRLNKGSGGVYIIKAAHDDDLAAYDKLIKETYESIDRYQSPSISRTVDNDGIAIARITYWGLD